MLHEQQYGPLVIDESLFSADERNKLQDIYTKKSLTQTEKQQRNDAAIEWSLDHQEVTRQQVQNVITDWQKLPTDSYWDSLENELHTLNDTDSKKLNAEKIDALKNIIQSSKMNYHHHFKAKLNLLNQPQDLILLAEKIKFCKTMLDSILDILEENIKLVSKNPELDAAYNTLHQQRHEIHFLLEEIGNRMLSHLRDVLSTGKVIASDKRLELLTNIQDRMDKLSVSL